MSKPTLIAAALSFFGLKEGQTKLQFGKEWQQLNDADKREIYDGFQKLGIDCDPPKESVAVKEAMAEVVTA